MASGFASTLKAIAALPCPLVSPDSGAHAALLVAVHEQSRFVVMVSAPVAPPAATFVASEFSTETWHLVDDGAVTPIELDVQESTSSGKAAARAARTRMMLPPRARRRPPSKDRWL